LKESEQGLCKLLGQNNDEPLEAILAEVAIESEGVVEFVTVDQNETGAIDEAEVLSSYRMKIALAVCSFASMTRTTLMPLWSNPFINSTAAR
jgi:hypothetical protein